VMATAEVLLGSIDQIPKGEGRTFRVADLEIAVFHTAEGAVYATQAFCPHRQGPLADGLLGGTTLMCPLHDRTFDLRSGCGTSHEQLDLATYQIRVSDGQIWLQPVPSPAPEAAE
jgi:nitrite reductase (NADH) small subunit